MLRTHSPVRPLTVADRDESLSLCARNPDANVFVAARIEEGALQAMPGSLLGYWEAGELTGLVWASANLVPAECSDEALTAIASRVRRGRRQFASIFGPTGQVERLWALLAPQWGEPRAVRAYQPLMTTATPARAAGIVPAGQVRPARDDEVDLVLPAAASMFTEEIGYPPYQGTPTGYRSLIAALVRRGRTLVWVDDGAVRFKADVGSVALGSAQVQGVWLHPGLRGRGLAVPLMAAVTDHVLDRMAARATLYVNDFNHAARATYRAIGYRETGSFTTVLL